MAVVSLAEMRNRFFPQAQEKPKWMIPLVASLLN